MDWTTLIVIGTIRVLVFGLVLLGVFLRHAHRKKSKALIDIELFKIRDFSIAATTQFLAVGIIYGGQFLIPLFLTRAQPSSTRRLLRSLAWELDPWSSSIRCDVIRSKPPSSSCAARCCRRICARKEIPRLDEIVGRAADAALGYGALAPVKRTSYPWDRFIRDA